MIVPGFFPVPIPLWLRPSFEWYAITVIPASPVDCPSSVSLPLLARLTYTRGKRTVNVYTKLEKQWIGTVTNDTKYL